MEEVIENYSPEIEQVAPVPSDKFDNHMSSARTSSMQARRKVFDNQNTENANKRGKYTNIRSSIY
jgi:hypothetical protein